MRRSSDEQHGTPDSRRGQVEPLAAIAAVLAIAAALTLYAGVVTDLFGESDSRETPDLILDRSVEAVADVGVIDPSRLDRIHETLPDGWRANVTIRGTDHWFASGPQPPANARKAKKRISVRLGPGRVVPGQFRVAVWR
jgi:hypothetical protein